MGRLAGRYGGLDTQSHKAAVKKGHIMIIEIQHWDGTGQLIRCRSWEWSGISGYLEFRSLSGNVLRLVTHVRRVVSLG